MSLEWTAPFRVDIGLTLSVHRRGPHDPTFRVEPSGAIWRTCLTPAGPATLRLTASAPDRRGVGAPSRPLYGPQGSRQAPGAAGGDAAGELRGSLTRARAWGPGARWVL
ncbi:MAG TPA: hypothetical protein VH520_05320, partial [Streptosporangiaceae bacterium]